MIQQPEFDFEHDLPAGVEFFSMRTLAATWRCRTSHVWNLLDDGSLPVWLDLRGPGSQEAMPRIPRLVVVWFLTHRTLRGATMDAGELDLDATIRRDREFFRLHELESLLRCSRKHLCRFIATGALARATDLGSAGSSKAMWRIPRRELVRWLTSTKREGND